MAKKKNQVIPMPNDVGHDFEDDRKFLHFRPTIAFVEPEQEIGESGTEPFQEDIIADNKNKIESMMADLDAIGVIADEAQKSIDDRVESLGSLSIALDPIVDATTISAMKRLFPNEPDPKRITYDQYKEALRKVMKHGKPSPTIGPLRMKEMQENKNKTDFGILALPPGMGRPEVSNSGGGLSPLNMGAFQALAVIALFALLLPLITKFVLEQIAIHYSMPGHTL